MNFSRKRGRTTTSLLKIGDEEIGRGLGRTKKAAEQVAAYHGICKIQ